MTLLTALACAIAIAIAHASYSSHRHHYEFIRSVEISAARLDHATAAAVSAELDFVDSNRWADVIDAIKTSYQE